MSDGLIHLKNQSPTYVKKCIV